MKAKHVKIRYSGKSFATASKKISDKYKDRDINPLSKRSFMAEIEELMKLQELVRSQEAAINTLQENKRFIKATGGMLPKLGLGGDGIARSINDGLAPPNTYLGLTSSSLITPLQKSMNPLMLNSPANVISPNLMSGVSSNKLPTSPTTSITGSDSMLPTLPLKSVTSIGPTVSQRGNDYLHKRPERYVTQTIQPRNVLSIGDSFENRVKTELGNEVESLRNRMLEANKAKKENKFLSKMMDPLIASKAAEFLGKGAMAIGGYDKYAPILNPYEAQSRRELENLRFDITPIQQRLQQEGARGRGSVAGIQNEAVRQALLQNTQSEIMGRTQEAMMSGQQQENQYRQARAAGLQSLGAENVAARNLSEQLTTQSKAGYQQSLQSMLTGVGEAGQEITNFRANTAQQQLLASTLKTKNFEIQDVSSIFKKAMSMGKMTVDDMLKFTQMNEQGQSKYVEEMKKNIGDDLKPSTTTTTKTTVAKRFGGILPGLKI